MRIDDYIKVGDKVLVMFRSVLLTGFEGVVLAISDETPGTREFIVQPDDKAEAVGVREDKAVFEVYRGDSWVTVPGLVSMQEASEKSERSVRNEKKRIEKKVPLLASLMTVRQTPAEQIIENNRLWGEDRLDFDHRVAMQALEWKEKVRPLVSAEDFEALCQRRTRYGRGGTYGIYVWRKQYNHIQEHGKPELIVPHVALNLKLNLPWLKHDATLTWTDAPGGAKLVKVLFVGSDSVMVKIQGEPIVDYDPKEYPYGNLWLTPDRFSEASGVLPAPATRECLAMAG